MEDSMPIVEPERVTPVVDHADVIIAGGGPAGIAAALAAARAGAKVRLIETNGCLGGVWTAGMLAWLFEMDQPGIAQEVTCELDRRGARHNMCTHSTKQYAYDIEAMKLLLEEMLLSAGVQIHLHSRVVAAIRDGRRIAAVITESKSGREAWTAPVFVDASGDGDLAARAGCGFDLGKPGTGALQPFTFMGLVTARDVEALRPFIVFPTAFRHDEFTGPTRAFFEEIAAAGVEPSYHASTLFHLRGNLLGLMINHQYGVSPMAERDVTKATISGRAEVNRVVEALRRRGGAWRDLLLVATPEQIGVREGRRIHGRYTVSEQDLLKGARHDDAVCNVTFQVDVHSTDPARGKGFEHYSTKTLPYDIPLRALVAKDVDNLLLAGRCISGDFIAHASYRVTGVSTALGQAAGIAAAIGAKARTPVAEISIGSVRDALGSTNA